MCRQKRMMEFVFRGVPRMVSAFHSPFHVAFLHALPAPLRAHSLMKTSLPGGKPIGFIVHSLVYIRHQGPLRLYQHCHSPGQRLFEYGASRRFGVHEKRSVHVFVNTTISVNTGKLIFPFWLYSLSSCLTHVLERC
jgi:hypothetical protein